MPASLVTLGGGDLFKSGGGADSLVNIPMVNSIIGPGGLAVYDSVSAQVAETLQFFITFDDVIKFIHFGKGLGNVTAQGTLFCDCSGDLPGASQVAGAIKGLRGKPHPLSVGRLQCTGVLTTASITVTGGDDTMGVFNFQFAIVNY